jgi:hypothetical protein
MPTVNVSEQGEKQIQRIQDHSEWSPSKREVVDKALTKLEEEIVGQDSE